MKLSIADLVFCVPHLHGFSGLDHRAGEDRMRGHHFVSRFGQSAAHAVSHVQVVAVPLRVVLDRARLGEAGRTERNAEGVWGHESIDERREFLIGAAWRNHIRKRAIPSADHELKASHFTR